MSEVSFVTTHNAYAGTNKTQIIQIVTELFF